MGTISASLRDVQLFGPIFLLNRKLGSDCGMLRLLVVGQIEYGLWLMIKLGNIDLSLATCGRLLSISAWWNLLWPTWRYSNFSISSTRSWNCDISGRLGARDRSVIMNPSQCGRYKLIKVFFHAKTMLMMSWYATDVSVILRYCRCGHDNVKALMSSLYARSRAILSLRRVGGAFSQKYVIASWVSLDPNNITSVRYRHLSTSGFIVCISKGWYIPNLPSRCSVLPLHSGEVDCR